MNNEDLLNKIKQLEEELEKTREHLKKYTAPTRSKTYYENHKEELLNKMKKYTPSPDKIKEKNRKAYLKRKDLIEFKVKPIFDTEENEYRVINKFGRGMWDEHSITSGFNLAEQGIIIEIAKGYGAFDY